MPSYTRTKETLVTAPVLEPVTLDEAKAHCRVFTYDDDAYISTLITVARQYLESVTWSSFLTQTWTFYWDRFYPRMYVPRGPVQSMTAGSFEYLPPGSGSTTWTDVSSTVYELSTENQLTFIRLAYLQWWPVARCYRDDVRATFTLGYGDNPSDMPAPLRQALLLLVSHMYLNRGEVPAELPQAIGLLIQPYRFQER